MDGCSEGSDDRDEVEEYSIDFGEFGDGCVSRWDEDRCLEEEDKPPESNDKKILWAAQKGFLEVVKELLELDGNLMNSRDKDGYTPLHRAACNDHLDVLQLLLEAGADPNTQTINGWTPLHSASYSNCASCVEKLVSLTYVDINSEARGGITPLHLAASVNNRAVGTLFTLLFHPAIDGTIRTYTLARRKSEEAKYFEMIEPCFNYI